MCVCVCVCALTLNIITLYWYRVLFYLYLYVCTCIDDKIALSKDHLSRIESRVSVVRDNHTAMEANQLRLEQELEKLKDRKQSEVCCPAH